MQTLMQRRTTVCDADPTSEQHLVNMMFARTLQGRHLYLCLHHVHKAWHMNAWARIIVQVTINRRLLIGRDGHLDQSKACDLS